MISGGSLTHKIAKAVFQGLFTNSKPFYRTPKMASSKPVLKNLTTVLEEIGLAVLLIVCAVVIMIVFGAVNDEAVLWTVALIIQGFPYYTAIIAAIVSGFAKQAEDVPTVSKTQDGLVSTSGNVGG